jgi:hypothetical protein
MSTNNPVFPKSGQIMRWASAILEKEREAKEQNHVAKVNLIFEK